MAEVQMRTLRVSAEMDGSNYAAGAKEIADSSKAAGAAARALGSDVEGVGNSAKNTDTKLSNAAGGAERLKRSYIDGYATAQKLEAALMGVSRELERGTFTAAEAALAADGIVRRHGLMGNSAQFAARGQIELAQAIDAANGRLTQQTMLAQRAQSVIDRQPVMSMNDNGAANRRQNLGYQLMDIGQSSAMGMNASMIAMQQGPQILQMYTGQGGLNAAMKDFGTIIGGVARVAGPALTAIGALYGGYKILESYSAAAGLAVDEATRALAAQAAPAESLRGQINELAQIQKAYSDAITMTAGSQDLATRSIIANSQREFEAKKALLELELLRQEAVQKTQQSEMAIAGLGLKQDLMAGGRNGFDLTSPSTYLNGSGSNPVVNDPGRLVRDGYADPAINGGIPFVRLPDEVSGMENLNKAIADNPATPALKQMQAQATLTQIAVSGLQDALKLVFNPAGDPLAENDGSRYTKALLTMQKAYREQYNPVPNFPNGVPVPSARPIDGGDEAAGVTKTENAYQQMIRTADQRIAQVRNEISIIGEATTEQARLRAEFEAEAQYREIIARTPGGKIDANEIALLRQKAGALADINSQLAAAKLVQGQQDQIEQLRLEISLVGASARERATMTAALQAEQQLRQQGIDLSTREAEAYKANAVAMAQARLELERQNAAYSSLEQAGGSAIDSLTIGTGSLQDRIKSAADTMLQWVQQLTIANPLKNALFGSNLPTMGDLFSGRPSVPGATSTGMMTVTAGTVMVNGGMSGGFPTMPGVTGRPGSLGEVIGAANGVKPDVVNGVMANAPVAANLNTKTGLPLSTISAGGLSANVNSQYAGNFQGFVNELQGSGYKVNTLGGYNYRNIRGTDTLSNHAFGNAIDINQATNPDTGRGGALVTDMPPNVSEMASKYGLKWGGDYQSKKDAMHFEVAPGAKPIGVDQYNTSMQKLAQTSATASKDITGLGDSSSKVGTTIADSLGKVAQTPALPTTPSPAAPTGGTNPFAALLGGIFKLLGFADGTEFAPGGRAIVGERGPELVNLPRGSQVIPTHKRLAQQGSGSRNVTMKHEVNINVSGNGDKELMERVQRASEETVKSGLALYNDSLPDRIEAYRQDPHSRGGF